MTDDTHVNPNAGAFNDFNEQFTPAGSSISFTVDMTSSYVSGSPDYFTFSILDTNGNPIPTNDPNSGENALLGATITGSSMTLSDVETYSATSSGQTISVSVSPLGSPTVVPEPSTMLLGGLGIAAFVGWFQVRRRRAA